MTPGGEGGRDGFLFPVAMAVVIQGGQESTRPGFSRDLHLAAEAGAPVAGRDPQIPSAVVPVVHDWNASFWFVLPSIFV